MSDGPLGYSSYGAYLNSPEWRSRRTAFAEKFPERCVVCGKSPCDLHHKTYVRVGRERDEDMEWRCPAHHDQVHAKDGAKRRSRRRWQNRTRWLAQQERGYAVRVAEYRWRQGRKRAGK